MVELRLAPEIVLRLARCFEAAPADDSGRSDHWRDFGARNRIAVDAVAGHVRFTAGAGFDSEYEFNFRPRTPRELTGSLLRRLTGRDDAARFKAAFEGIWRGRAPIALETAAALLGGPLTAHKVLAVHYANLVLPHLAAGAAFNYLEIGPGSGYLAALIHHHRPGQLVLIDLPDMLPYSFLMLHRLFPAESFVLPNEIDSPLRAGGGDRMFFLTPARVDAIPDGCIDLAVNTASFGEMLPEQIVRYFSLLRRCAKPAGLFFTSNRVEKWMKRPGVAAPSVPIRFADYPWLPEDRDLFCESSEFHARVQPDNPACNRLCRLARRDAVLEPPAQG